ncbi:MAG: hypothetical protein ACP5U1_12615 [Desulfomonilaceae bacterium]
MSPYRYKGLPVRTQRVISNLARVKGNIYDAFLEELMNTTLNQIFGEKLFLASITFMQKAWTDQRKIDRPVGLI